MEKPIYPMRNMRITQGYNEGTHKNSFAIDDAGKDTNIETLIAPFTGYIKKIYVNDANEVWLESENEVEYPDGTIDYMTIMFAHSNDVKNLYIGKRINQKEEFYKEGTKGNATGNHCHIECGKGRFTGSGWYKNESGYYSINNGKKPEECLWVDDGINIINNNNYNFKRIINKFDDEQKNNEDNKDNNKVTDNKKLIYMCEKKDLYGIYLNIGDKLYIENKHNI